MPPPSAGPGRLPPSPPPDRRPPGPDRRVAAPRATRGPALPAGILAGASPPAREAADDWGGLIRRAWLVILLVFGAGGVWSLVARLDQGAIAPGVVAVASHRKAVQHLEGGIVRDLAIRNGDRVEEGQVLLRLDDTQARATVSSLAQQLASTLAEEARLVAEQGGAAEMILPPDVVTLRGAPAVARAVADQTASFRQRKASLEGQQGILEARVRQLEEVIAGTRGERAAAQEQVATIRRELGGLRDLLAKNLVQLPRVLALEREEASLRGQIGRTGAEIARYEQAVGETHLQIRQMRQQFLETVSRDLPVARKAAAELREKLAVAQDVLTRIELRAPRSGVVQGLRVFTVGGVVKPGETLMEIVPADDELVVQARISPQDIDTVHVGQEAEIRFPAFASRHPPIFMGRVRALSRDRLVANPGAPGADALAAGTGAAPGEPYFAAEIAVDRAAIPEPFRDRIMAGMAGDVVIATGERTAIAYVLGPLLDRLRLGMRER